MSNIKFGLQDRAVALYRASTKQQTGDNNDLPSQKKLVTDYINANQLNLIKEFTEGGVSGYKNLASEREAINDILDMAKNNEFDILIIYHSNRLGRLAEDTPALITKLSKLNIRVISTIEGELKAKTPMDRFLNNVRFFGNEQESALKSEVISDYHIAMVEEGRFRGGSMIPYGYKLVDNGNKNFKGKHILDFIIDNQEADIIKKIFYLSVEMNYGQSRIAKYLNEQKIPTKKNGAWHSSSIQVILNNPIYMGRFRYTSKVREKTVISPTREDLIIIQEDIWNRNQEIMKSRVYEKKDYDTSDNRTSKNTYGKMLLNGIAICGYCGMALTTMTAYNVWKTADGVKHKTKYYKYRCASFYKKGGIDCSGQSTYSAPKIELTVINEAKKYIKKLEGKKIQDEYLKGLDKKIIDLTKKKKNLLDKVDSNNKKLTVLQEEFVKVLMGQSDSSKDMVNNLIKSCEEDISNITIEIKDIDIKINSTKYEKENYITLGEEFVDWDIKFDNADLEKKRLMLSRIIDKVRVYKDEIYIDFGLTIETYKNNLIQTDSTDCKQAQLARVLP